MRGRFSDGDEWIDTGETDIPVHLKTLVLEPDCFSETLDEAEALIKCEGCADLLAVAYNTVLNLNEPFGIIDAYCENPRGLDRLAVKTHRKNLRPIRLGFINDERALFLADYKKPLLSSVRSDEGDIFV